MHPRAFPATARLATAAALVLGTLAGSGLAQQRPGQPAAAKKVYCWDEGGRKVCGDALPAEAANAARTEFSTRSGLATRRVARALNDAERVVAAQQAEANRIQAELEAAQLRRDLAMVESYAAETDLRRAYADRTTLLDETIKTSQLGLQNLRLSLLSLLRQAGDQELAGEAVPAPLRTAILSQHDELLHQQRILADQRRDRAALDSDLADAVQRYRVLKQPAGASTPAEPSGPPPAR